MKQKTAFLSIRMSLQEKEHLDKLCEESGLNSSTLIRNLIEGTQIRPRRAKEIGELYKEINAIGVNINQIARSVNAGIASQADIRQSLFLLQKVYDLMEDVADM
ncbi:MAG: plasmid mobilization relaxosome protein MobC [Christensenellaceae bacterium]